MAIIYKITNKINGKVYIGETIRPLNTRWNRHLSNARSGKKEHLYCSMREYGIENFSIEEIDRCPNDVRFAVETSYIIKYNSLEPNGYNWLLYQNGYSPDCEDIIVQDWENGLTIKEISEKRHIGVKTVSGILKNNNITQEEIFNRRTENTKKRSGKAVSQYDLNGVFIAEYDSASEAARELGVPPAAISKSCNNNLLSAHGFIWQYQENDKVDEVVEKVKNKSKAGKNKKRISQYTTNNEFIQTFESASAAGRSLNKTHAGIARAARKGGTAYGFKWKYED